MEVRQGWQARARPVLALREGHVPQGPTAEYPALEQGPGGNPEASTRRGLAVSDADLEPAAQVRVRAAQGSLATKPLGAILTAPHRRSSSCGSSEDSSWSRPAP